MALPSPMPLGDFERTIQADPQVLGMFYFGSLGRGTATPYSDLDIYLWFSDDVVMPAHDKVRQILGLLGEIHWIEIDGGRSFIGPGWLQVDFEWSHRHDLEPAPRFAGGVAIKDLDGTLAQFLTTCDPDHPVETPESAAVVIREAIGDLIFQARHNARGSVWSATGNTSYLCTITYELLGRLRGRRTFGHRYVEELLTTHEQALLASAWPREPTREENRRAARATWEWTKYVWREAERVIGQPLGIEVDEAGMLAAIEQFYG
jgi:hypothetical protein